MATFVVCSRCGDVQEIPGLDQLPEGWQRSHDLLCPHCAIPRVPDFDTGGDVLDEEVIYPAEHDAPDDTLDEGFCEICHGPCQGH